MIYFFKKREAAIDKQEELREVLEMKRKCGEVTEEEYKDELYNLEEPIRAAYDEYLDAMQNMLNENEYLDYGIYVEQSAF